MELDSKTYRISGASKYIMIALVVGLIGLAASAIGVFGQSTSDQASYSYLVALLYWTSIGLGALGFVMIHNMVHARWSIVIRRVQESVMMALPVMFVLFIPLLALLFMGKLETLYPWTSHDAVAHSEILQGKTAWLNPKFFAARTVLYFAIWTVLGVLLWKASRRQDEEGPSQKLYDFQRTVSGPGIVLFALSLTFASFDWIMSTTPLWYSTMFGVYLFSMGVLSMWCFMALLVSFLRSQGVLEKEVSVHHFHDMGKWMFAFTVFWAYIAFCQFILIWYANIPEETEYYYERWFTDWQPWTLLVLVGHFFVPFLLMMSRIPKRKPTMVAFMAIWILVMHWVELYWLVMPTLHKHSYHLHWLDFTTLVGVGGVFIAAVLWRLSSAPVLAVKDPYLQKSIDFVNV